jgi:hypothetical protein
VRKARGKPLNRRAALLANRLILMERRPHVNKKNENLALVDQNHGSISASRLFHATRALKTGFTLPETSARVSKTGPATRASREMV